MRSRRRSTGTSRRRLTKDLVCAESRAPTARFPFSASARVSVAGAPPPDQLKASGPPAASRLHWSGIAVVHAGPDAALAARPLRQRWHKRPHDWLVAEAVATIGIVFRPSSVGQRFTKALDEPVPDRAQDVSRRFGAASGSVSPRTLVALPTFGGGVQADAMGRARGGAGRSNTDRRRARGRRLLPPGPPPRARAAKQLWAMSARGHGQRLPSQIHAGTRSRTSSAFVSFSALIECRW
jgi:hypothetical protein